MGLFDKFKKKEVTEKMPMYLYTEQELDEYEAFIEKNFGSYDSVIHEIASPDIHLDIIIVPPTEDNPFYKMITMGMGAYKMNVPYDLAEYELEYAELVLYLPPDWRLDSFDEKDYWPIRLMKILGRIPINSNSWLGFGHTAYIDGNGSHFAENTEFNTMLLLNACNLKYEKLDLRLSSGKKINFYQMFPLYQEELDIKLAASLEELLNLFDDDDKFPLLNINRKNYGYGTGNGCIATKRIVEEDWNVGYMYREEPVKGKPDSGWRFFKGDEDDDYTNVTGNHTVCHISTIAALDPDIVEHLDAPVGASFIRIDEHTFIEDDGNHVICMTRRDRGLSEEIIRRLKYNA